MKFNQKRVKDLGLLTVVVIATQMLLSKYIYPMFNATTQQLFAITPQTAVTSPTIGNKVIGFLSGIVPFSLGDFSSWIAMFIGAFLMLALGYWVYEQKWAWKGKDIYQRLWAILLYGSAALYVFLLVTKMEAVSVLAMPLLIGVAVNYLIIALVVTTLAKHVKFLRI